MKKREIINILVQTLHDFYREDRGDKRVLFSEKIKKLNETYPDKDWYQIFSANIDKIKAGEKKLSLNKKLKKINK